MNKYIILDEVELELQKDKKGNVMLFNSEEIAILKAKCNSWRVIEIPFGE